jgi:hypothetical protein
MTFLPDIPELDYWGIYERGVPGKERIVFKPRIGVMLTQYCIVVGQNDVGGMFRPFFDNAFFFPDVAVVPPAWVFVFTGRGTATITFEGHTKEPLHSLYWGRSETIFHDPRVVANLFPFESMARPPERNKQIGRDAYQHLLTLNKE